MRQLILIIFLFSSIVNIANAIPIPALVVGWDFVILAIPAILWVFSAIYFYFRKYIFWINIYLLLFSIFLYFIHYNITKELFLFEYEFLIFWIFILFLWLIYKFKKLNFLNYLITLLLIWISFFLIKIDYNLWKYVTDVNKFTKIVWKSKINKVLIKDNFFVIYFNNYRKELVVSNCMEWEKNNKYLLLKKNIKDFDKHPLKNWMCIYWNYWDYEFNTMYNIIIK